MLPDDIHYPKTIGTNSTSLPFLDRESTAIKMAEYELTENSIFKNCKPNQGDIKGLGL